MKRLSFKSVNKPHARARAYWWCNAAFFIVPKPTLFLTLKPCCFLLSQFSFFIEGRKTPTCFLTKAPQKGWRAAQ